MCVYVCVRACRLKVSPLLFVCLFVCFLQILKKREEREEEKSTFSLFEMKEREEKDNKEIFLPGATKKGKEKTRNVIICRF